MVLEALVVLAVRVAQVALAAQVVRAVWAVNRVLVGCGCFQAGHVGLVA